MAMCWFWVNSFLLTPFVLGNVKKLLISINPNETKIPQKFNWTLFGALECRILETSPFGGNWKWLPEAKYSYSLRQGVKKADILRSGCYHPVLCLITDFWWPSTLSLLTFWTFGDQFVTTLWTHGNKNCEHNLVLWVEYSHFLNFHLLHNFV